MRVLLAVVMCVATPGLGCTFPEFGRISLDIRGDRLVAMAGDERVGRIGLPVLERDWRCLQVHAYPEYGEVYLEWDQGVSGTDIRFRRRTLLGFRLDSGLSETRRWTLFQSYEDGAESIVHTDRRYRLIRTPYGVRVILESG